MQPILSAQVQSYSDDHNMKKRGTYPSWLETEETVMAALVHNSYCYNVNTFLHVRAQNYTLIEVKN